ncbi:TPA: methionine ABC transporter permease [Streptococcus suis]|uniref:D-methionine transport system permease protein n=1 Tax=Streptococcus parasuis TaxID=1501662 RepID=A0ABV2ETE2_9STRE|nr:methionine ABC transporter permease [Streptococcus parasuis]BCP60051.1 methionine ABC transporter permease protein [Streptococcus parasuis]
MGIKLERLAESGVQTIYMLSLSLLFGLIIGIPIALLLVTTRPGGLKENRIVFTIVSNLVNIFRSLPFVILLIFISPVTKLIVGTRIGTRAAIVPLVVYIAPYLARLIENSLLEVKKGILEAAQSMGASWWQIIYYFLLPEAKSSLILTITTGSIGLLGATAMAGIIGGGGIGDLALTYGYQRFNTVLMVTTVLILIVFVQSLQGIGNYLANHFRN